MEQREMEDRVRRAMQRSAGQRPTLERPPAELWDRIQTELTESAEPERKADVVPLASRRRPAWAWVAGAAAVIVVVVGIVLGSTLTGDDSSEQQVAVVELAPLDGSGSGAAALVDVDGSLRLDLDISGVDPGAGFLEVWLLDPDVTQLVSLGPVRSDGRYEVPAGLDVAALPVVDISVEEFNGDPTHSGVSVLRGQLDI